MDTEEIEVFKTRLQKWCKKNDVEGVSADEAAINEVGLDLETKHFFDVYGLVVSERRIVDNVDGFNIFVNISMQLLIVLAQLILVILPPIILIVACFGQQQIHKDTVAMFPVLDFNSIQALGGENVAFKSLEMYSLTTINETIFYICIGYYFFATAKLIIYYVFHKYDGSYLRTILKSLFVRPRPPAPREGRARRSHG